MFYLIYGEDSYRSKQKLEAIKEKYRSLCGDSNLVDINAEDSTFDSLVGQISTMPFLANKRLVVLRYLSKAKDDVREKLLNYLPKMPDSTVLFFYEEKADMRLTFFKTLLKNKKQCEEFKLLDEPAVKKLVQIETEKAGLKINPMALNQLIGLIGVNLWDIFNELEKIIAYKIGQKNYQKNSMWEVISQDDVLLLVSENPQVNVFNYIDSLQGKNISCAIKDLDQLLRLGENELRLFGLIVSQFRNLVLVKDLLQGNPAMNNFQISKLSGINPYVVSKLAVQCRKVSFEWAKKAYGLLGEIDYQIKSGELEPKLALNLLTIRLCGNLDIE